MRGSLTLSNFNLRLLASTTTTTTSTSSSLQRVQQRLGFAVKSQLLVVVPAVLFRAMTRLWRTQADSRSTACTRRRLRHMSLPVAVCASEPHWQSILQVTVAVVILLSASFPSRVRCAPFSVFDKFESPCTPMSDPPAGGSHHHHMIMI